MICWSRRPLDRTAAGLTRTPARSDVRRVVVARGLLEGPVLARRSCRCQIVGVQWQLIGQEFDHGQSIPTGREADAQASRSPTVLQDDDQVPVGGANDDLRDRASAVAGSPGARACRSTRRSRDLIANRHPGDRTQGKPNSADGTTLDRIDRVLGSAVGPETVSLLDDLDPSALPGAALVRALLICRSLSSWVDATEQSVLAALSRPGVAVPVERVIDAARWSAAKPGELAAPDRVLEESTNPVTDPRCREAVAHHAARFAAMEVSAALHLSPLGARMRVERARQLVDALPNTHAALREGRLDMFRAGILADDTALLTPEVRRTVESEVLDGAQLCTPAQLRARVARTVLRLDPDGAADRCRSARRHRDVYARPLPNDLSSSPRSWAQTRRPR